MSRLMVVLHNNGSHTKDGAKEGFVGWEAEDVCVYDLPPILFLVHQIFIVLAVLGEVIFQHPGLQIRDNCTVLGAETT